MIISGLLEPTPPNFRAEKARHMLRLKDIHDHLPRLNDRVMTVQLLSMYLAESRRLTDQAAGRIAVAMNRAVVEAGGQALFAEQRG